MKTSLVLQPRRQLSRAEAWGCLTANLALPGSGSLVAGRAVGYAQLVLSMIGMGISLVAGWQFIVWYVRNWDRLHPFYADEVASVFQEIWMHFRWPLFGFTVFLIALLWGLITSLQILSKSPKLPVPPRIL